MGGGAQSYLQERSDFFEDAEARGVYVALLTLEGSIQFDDVIEFGEHCGEFCKQKQRETIISEPLQDASAPRTP